MKCLLILFLIFLVIAISGCVGQDGTPISAKDGVVITDFSFDHSPIYGGDNVGLYLEIQNVGGTKAYLKEIQVYGVDFVSGMSTEREWGIRKGFQVLDEDYIETNLPSKGELYPPNPDINLEGATDYHEWRLQAPKGVVAKTDYDFSVRVKYGYETTYAGTIRIINDDYLQTLSEEDRQKLYSTDGVISSELTNGPISIIPYSGRHFIVMPDEEEDPRIIKFKIENVGKGYPYVDDKMYYIRIVDIEGDRNIIVNCAEEENWEIKLSAGKSHTMECKFKPPMDVANQIDKPFQITFKYRYYVDDSTSITVKPAY